jgi:hypothetical protein
MFTYFFERLLALFALFARRPEPVALRIVPIEAIIAARRNARG